VLNCPNCRARVTPGATDCALCGALLVRESRSAGHNTFAQGVRYLSRLYVAVLIAATLVDFVIACTTPYRARAGTGCNFYDALLIGIECRGFLGSGFVEIVLGLPLLVIYVSALVPSWPLMLVPAALLWSPVLYLVHSAWRRTSERR